MAQRPSTEPEWAEKADAKDIADPDVERDTGYFRGQSLAHDQLNWLFRELFRWLDWFDEKFQGNTGLIDFFETIDFGDNINVELAKDGSLKWIAKFLHAAGGESEIWADLFRSDVLQTKQLESLRSDDLIGVYGEDQGSVGGVLLDMLQMVNTDDEIDVRGNDGTSGDGGFFLNFLRASGDLLDVRASDGSTGGGEVLAQNTAKAWGVITPDDATPGDPSLDESFNVQSVTRQADGKYNVTLSISDVQAGNSVIVYSVIGADPTTNDTTLSTANFTTINLGGDFTIVVLDDSGTPLKISEGSIMFTVFSK